MQSREIVCTDTAGAVYPEETCVDITKPDIMQHCDKKKDKCKPKWVSTDWTEVRIRNHFLSNLSVIIKVPQNLKQLPQNM